MTSNLRFTRVLTLSLLFALLIACAGGVERAAPPATQNQQVTNRGAEKDNWWDALPRAAWARHERVAQTQEWFEVYALGNRVYAIYEPGQFEEVISYLIIGSERALLFDTGLGIGDMRRLVGELTPLDVVVVNSHSHYDHIGGNAQFDSVAAADSSFAAERAAGLAHAEVAEFVGPGWLARPTPSGFAAGDYHVAPYTIGRRLRDGARIELGDRTLEVLLTPGHTPDALCLLERNSGWLFTGDTFYLAPLYAHFDNSDPNLYLDSARRLAALGEQVAMLLPGHNETAVSAAYLGKMHAAFKTIAAGATPTTISDGKREFQFDGFSIIVD